MYEQFVPDYGCQRLLVRVRHERRMLQRVEQKLARSNTHAAQVWLQRAIDGLTDVLELTRKHQDEFNAFDALSGAFAAR